MMKCCRLLKKMLVRTSVYRYKKPLLAINLVNRIKKISMELMTTYKGKFDNDFVHNKKVLNEVAIVRSKGLKNEIAGYISTYIKRELEDKAEKESEAAAIQNESVEETEEIEEQILN